MRNYDIYRIKFNGAYMDTTWIKTISAKSQAHAEKQIKEPGVYVAALSSW